jgi:hypothetical protein
MGSSKYDVRVIFLNTLSATKYRCVRIGDVVNGTNLVLVAVHKQVHTVFMSTLRVTDRGDRTQGRLTCLNCFVFASKRTYFRWLL